MRIGEVAAEVGLEPSAIRYYETNDIVPRPQRTQSGYRDYDGTDIELLRFVRRLRSLELPLDDIRQIVALRIEGQAPCSTVREAIAREAHNIERRIEDLMRLQSELSSLQKEADRMYDDWPTSCICHVLESV